MKPVRRIQAVLVCAFLAALAAAPSPAQEILLDDFVRAGGLLLFRSYGDPLTFYYVADRPGIAVTEDGKPEFSFVKYARNIAGAGAEGGIREAAGGGVVHFLVNYAVPQDVIAKAGQELQEKVEDAVIAGPVLFRSGRFALVTTIAAEGGRYANKLVGVGKAPLIEGAKAAVSIDLSPQGASLLWESFKMENPDISIVFEMEIAGLRSPYDATMEVDWDQVYGDEKIAAGLKLLWLGGDVEAVVSELRQKGAIKLQTKGENAAMDAIVQRAHAKVTELMFAPAESPPPETAKGGDPFAAVAALLGQKPAGKTPAPISLHGSYKLKNVKRSGKAKFDFNHVGSDSLNITMAGNVGDLYKTYGKDQGIFRATNLDDPVFKQREIFVTVDGRSEKEFTDYINFVTVQIKKQHENGEASVDEVLIDAQSFKRERNRFRLVYGWKGDDDRDRWLQYDYRLVWNFRQDVQFETSWERTGTFVINVAPPYEYRRVSLEADPEIFKRRNVRHALVKFHYGFFGKPLERQAVVRAAEGEAAASIEYVCEAGRYDYDYEITWYLRGGGRLQSGRLTDSSDILYVDELPEEPAPAGKIHGG